MPKDVLAEALRAAAYALEHQDERKQGAATSWEELAAVAIAEFLRALPNDRALWLDSGPGRKVGIAPHGHEALAATVERAARERG